MKQFYLQTNAYLMYIVKYLFLIRIITSPVLNAAIATARKLSSKCVNFQQIESSMNTNANDTNT